MCSRVGTRVFARPGNPLCRRHGEGGGVHTRVDAQFAISDCSGNQHNDSFYLVLFGVLSGVGINACMLRE